MIAQVVQIIGAFLVLGGFAGAQLKWFDSQSLRYLMLNFIGSALLAIVAIRDREWGFILLESTWTAVSLLGLAGLYSRRTVSA